MTDTSRKRSRKTKLVPREFSAEDDVESQILKVLKIVKDEPEDKTPKTELKPLPIGKPAPGNTYICILKRLGTNSSDTSQPAPAPPIKFDIEVEIERNNDDNEETTNEITEKPSRSLLKPINTDIKQLFLCESKILRAADKILKTSTNAADKILDIGVRNTVGHERKGVLYNKKHDAKIEEVLEEWKEWEEESTHRESPLFYKCYICDKAWWNLYEFRKHIAIHPHLQIGLEKCEEHEINLVAFVGNKISVKEIYVKGFCNKCGHDYDSHQLSKRYHKRFYKNEACTKVFYTCTGLRNHMITCEQCKTADKESECQICNSRFDTEDLLLSHSALCHTVRTDVPINTQYNTCNECSGRYFSINLHICANRGPRVRCRHCFQTFSNRMLCKLHVDNSSQHHYCNICFQVIIFRCQIYEHMMDHTNKYMFLKKCVICEDYNVFLTDKDVLQHMTTEHPGRAIKSHYVKEIIVPKSCVIEAVKTKAKPVSATKPVPTTKPVPECKTQTLTVSEIKSLPESEVKLLPKSDSKPIQRCNIKPVPGPKPKMLPKPETKLGSEAEVEPETTLISRSESKVIPRCYPKPVPGSKAKILQRCKTNLIPASETKPVPVCKTRILPTSESKPLSDTEFLPGNETKLVPVVPQQEEENVTIIKEEPPDYDDHPFDIVIKEEMVDPEEYTAENNPYMPEVQIKQEFDEDYEQDIIKLDILNDGLLIPKQELQETNQEIETSIEENFEDHTAYFPIIVKEESVLNPEIIIGQRKRIRKIYTCSQCGFQGCHREYKEHYEYECLRSTRKSQPYYCTKCSKEFYSMKKYLSHFVHHGYEPLACPECLKKFYCFTKLTPHVQSHIKQNFLRVKSITQDCSRLKPECRCKKCGEAVKSASFFDHWEQHIHSNPQAAAAQLKMKNNCDKLEGTQQDLVQESLMWLQKLPKTCNQCNRKFNRINECKRHIIEHLLAEAYSRKHESGALVCQKCGLGFPNQEKYKQHMRDHASLPVYRCEHCDRTFSDSSNFTKHKKVHNMQVYMCDLCKKKFQTKRSLEKHIAMHQTTKPITCDSCIKVFYCQSHYQRHLKYSHDKPSLGFRCVICNQRFATLKEKWNHMWEEHKERKLKADCPICFKSFRKYTDVKSHAKSEHNRHVSVVSVNNARKKKRNITEIKNYLRSQTTLKIVPSERETLVVF